MTAPSPAKAHPAQKLRLVRAQRPRGNRRRESAVVAEVRAAFAPDARLATAIGLVLGGFVPAASYVVCHVELPGAEGGHHLALLALVLGGLLFSAKTVWQWARLAFDDPWKATGFALILEGVMVLSGVPALAYCALGLLVGINGIATGCRLSRGGQ